MLPAVAAWGFGARWIFEAVGLKQVRPLVSLPFPPPPPAGCHFLVLHPSGEGCGATILTISGNMGIWEYGFVKTTLEIGDALYREVKALSALTGRKMTDPVKARSLAIRGLAAVRAVEVPVDAAFLAHATLIGTRHFLRGADALYAAAAEVTGGGLVSWNGEHRSRAKALSPTE